MAEVGVVYAYAALLAAGGAAGFALKGSVPSLLGGCGSAVVLATCATVSHRASLRGQVSKPAMLVELGMAGLLTLGMSLRWQTTRKFMPAGLVSVLSAAMTAFMLYHVSNLLPPPRAHRV